MRSRSISLLLLLCLPLLNAATPSRIRAAADSRQSKALSGSVRRLSGAESDQGVLDPSTPLSDITLIVKLSDQQQADLDNLVRDQQNPSSPQYQKWLTPEQFGDRFGLSSSDEAKITAWLASEGLQFDRTRSHNSLRIRGTAEQVSHALHTNLHKFRINGQNRFAATTEPSVPAAFADVIAGFAGLDDFPLESKAKYVSPNYNSGTSHFLTPEDFATIYNLSPLYSAGIDGTGQSIVVVGQSAISMTDIRAFRTRYNLPANDPKLLSYSSVDPGYTSSQIEGTLDVEWAGAIAPKAAINYIYGTSAFTAMLYAVQLNLSPVISISYGGCETDYSPLIYRAAVQQANAQGITILVASGDSGAASCNLNGEGPIAARGIAPQFPASMPEVTAVGGTQFVEGTGNYWARTNSPNLGSALSYIPEAVWNESSQAMGLASSGGGASKVFPQPAWQNGPGVPSDGARHVPDVSLSAATHDAYFINYSGVNGGVGGTSASAPAMAGIVALINHYQVSKGFQRTPGLGNINPQLYRLAKSAPAVFHDIIDGDNMVPCLQASPDCLTGSFGYKAAAGYDMATGLGSVDGNALVTQWNSATAPVTVTLVADPGPRTLNDSIQLTATVAAAGGGSPTGSVSFMLAIGTTSLPVGNVPVTNGKATLSVPLYIAGGTGTYTMTAQYSGDESYSAGGAALRVTISSVPSGSAAVIIPTQVVNVWPGSPDAQGYAWNTTLSLREVGGVPAMLTEFKIDGETQDLAKYFPSPNIPANGTLSSVVVFRNLNAPVTRTFAYSGIDGTGKAWSRQIQVTFLSRPSYSYFTLSATPLVAVQNPSADPSCQWSTQLNLDDQDGNDVNLITSMYLGNGYYGPGANVSNRIQRIFGSSRLAPYGGLQGTLCFDSATPGDTTQVLVNMLDGQFQEVSIGFAGPAAKPMKLTAAPASLSMAAAAGKTAEATLDINLTDTTQSWSISVFPANRTTAWLKPSALSGTGNGKITLTADGTGFAPGVYRANLAIQSASAVPQVTNVPIMFVLGGSSTTSINGGILYGSTIGTGSPGTLFNITGSNLANDTQSAAKVPLEYSLAGVTATVNGQPAPVLSTSPDVVTIQIPYEVGAGPAVVGIHNNGEIAGYQFQMAPAAPGIFSEADGMALGHPAAAPGGYVTLYVSGIGDITPALLTGYASSSTSVTLLPKPVLPLSVTVGGVPAFIQFAGLPRGVVGLGQINVLLPGDTPSGTQPVVVTVNGVASPPVNITVQ